MHRLARPPPATQTRPTVDSDHRRLPWAPVSRREPAESTPSAPALFRCTVEPGASRPRRGQLRPPPAVPSPHRRSPTPPEPHPCPRFLEFCRNSPRSTNTLFLHDFEAGGGVAVSGRHRPNRVIAHSRLRSSTTFEPFPRHQLPRFNSKPQDQPCSVFGPNLGAIPRWLCQPPPAAASHPKAPPPFVFDPRRPSSQTPSRSRPRSPKNRRHFLPCF